MTWSRWRAGAPGDAARHRRSSLRSVGEGVGTCRGGPVVYSGRMAGPGRDSVEMIPLDACAVLRSAPDLYLVVLPDLRIAEASDAYLRATMTVRDAIIGRDLFVLGDPRCVARGHRLPR